MMTRSPAWRSRLVASIDAWQALPADAPDRNCGFFVADAVKAMTDIDFAVALRGQGLGIVEGLRTLRETGYRDAVDFAAKHLVEVPPSKTQFGDIVAVKEDGELALGVSNGAEIAVLKREGGIGFVPLTEAVRAFRV